MLNVGSTQLLYTTYLFILYKFKGITEHHVILIIKLQIIVKDSHNTLSILIF